MDSLCAWWTFVTVWIEGWQDTAVHRQFVRSCGCSEGSGGAGSSCGPSQGWFVGLVFGAGSVYPLDGLWLVRVSVVVGRWHARVYGDQGR
jgi:hypothetical protein